MATSEVDFWLEFIQIYRENPCLWDTTSTDYHSVTKRNLAYGMLVEKLWEINENADIATVRKKIGSFRSSLRREIRRMNKIEKEGLGTIYKPTWCYFQALSFLLSQEQGSGNEDDDAIEITSDEMDSNSEPSQSHRTTITKEIAKKPAPKETSKTDIADKQGPVSQVRSKKIKISPFFIDNTAAEIKAEEEFQDDSSAFAAHMKTKMRLFDPEQKCIAQKLISDVMFMAETKQLQMTSRIVNDPTEITGL